ncbi:hypothetical protein ANCCAN_08582 [Ancylostoma caninum]|uniref:Uncharacterized protein n=1 Tax=Ancylostoma caninum TaxID=29170 RepID=A0A368GM20_ANCCA|nr:hypothetical protein ANCCAN_08582 [Ancylostoma caninum]
MYWKHIPAPWFQWSCSAWREASQGDMDSFASLLLRTLTRQVRNRYKNGPVIIVQPPRDEKEKEDSTTMEVEKSNSKSDDIWKDTVSTDPSTREKPISLKDLFPDTKVVDGTLKRKLMNRKKRENAKRRRVNREERLREWNAEKEEKEKITYRESANRLIIGRIVRGDFSFYTASGRALSYVPLCVLKDIRKALPESWSVAYASDPTEWERKFDECWDMTQLIAQLTRMCQLLMMEVNAQPEPAIGLILDRYFTQQIMERVLDWAIQVPDFLKPTCQLALIRVYELIVSESHTQNHCLLVHKPILNPLLRLFEWLVSHGKLLVLFYRRTVVLRCERADGLRPNKLGHPSATEKHFVVLLNQQKWCLFINLQICTKLAEDRTLLHFFFSCTDGADQFIVFSLLIPFLYEQNDVGQLARDALLLILSVSAKHEHIAEFVAYKSAFCPVVATGLSGCFSQLGRILTGDGAERIVPEHAAESLANFHSSLLFCNAVVQAAHPSVVEQICNFFYSGFLISVVKPALLQEEQEAVAAATVYLQLCVETVTEAPLLRTVIRMLLLERDDEDRALVDVVVGRIANGDKLGVVSLSLLDSLLQIGCEDLMLVLVLRHLLPMHHVTRAQLSKVRDRSQAVASAERLLDCVPQCMLTFPEICSEDTVSLYLQEGAQLVERRARACSAWKWRYDGVHPSPVLFRGDSDDEPNLHTPFTRLSSCRSSMSSASFGLNRYFASKSSHLTSESALGVGENVTGFLAELGGSPTRSIDGSISPVEEDSEFILPPINTSSIMTSSMVDYFQLAAYDDLSESEESPSSTDKKEGLRIDGKKIECQKQESLSEAESAATGQGFDTDAEMARSFVLSGWADVEDLDTFISLLDRRTIPSKQKTSAAETMAFIDSKLQYMKEMQIEKEEPPKIEKETKENERVVQVRGQPIDAGQDSSLFLDSLLTQLGEMTEHSLAFNLQLANVLCSLAAYPQPVLVASIFNTKASDGFPHLIQVLSELKERVDAAANGIEGLDVYVGRALRTLNGRAEKMERYSDGYIARLSDSPRDDSFAPITSFLRGRPFGSSGRRSHGIRCDALLWYHSHKAVESEAAARDDAASKNIVHAAIVLANLCQYLAGIAMQQSIAVVGSNVR